MRSVAAVMAALLGGCVGRTEGGPPVAVSRVETTYVRSESFSAWIAGLEGPRGEGAAVSCYGPADELLGGRCESDDLTAVVTTSAAYGHNGWRCELSINRPTVFRVVVECAQ